MFSGAFFLFGGMEKSAAGRLPSLILYPLLHLEAAATLALRPPGLQYPDGNAAVVSFGHTVAQDLGAEEESVCTREDLVSVLGEPLVVPEPLVVFQLSILYPLGLSKPF